MPVVMIRAAADQVAIHDAGLVDEDPADDLEVELALGDGGHAAALEDARTRRYLDAMADGCDRLVGLEEMTRDADQIGIVSQILGGATPGEEDPQILFRADVPERNGRLDRVAFELARDPQLAGTSCNTI